MYNKYSLMDENETELFIECLLRTMTISSQFKPINVT